MTENNTSVFRSKEDYQNMRKDWAEYFNTSAKHLKRNKHGNKLRKLTPQHFAFYALLRNKDPRTCFSPNTSEESLENFLDFRGLDLTPFPMISRRQAEQVFEAFVASQKAEVSYD